MHTLRMSQAFLRPGCVADAIRRAIRKSEQVTKTRISTDSPLVL